jgi:hypothetical protein
VAGKCGGSLAMAYSTSFARAVECAAWFQDGELGRASQAGSTVTCSSSWGAGGGRSPQKQLQQSRVRNLQADRLGLAFSHESLRRSAFSNNKFQPGSCSRKERPGGGCGPVALIGGFSGAFWDGADSESTADEHVAAKKGASCTEVWKISLELLPLCLSVEAVSVFVSILPFLLSCISRNS